MKFDDILKAIGEFGPYQKRVFLLAALPAIFVAFEAVSAVFIFTIPPHRCAIPGFPDDMSYHVTNDTHAMILQRAVPKDNGKWTECEVYTDASYETILSDLYGNPSDNTSQRLRSNVSYMGNANVSSCHQWVFDHSVFEATIATDFDIACHRSILRASSNLVAEAGSLLGTLICGFLADRFGRKISFYVTGLTLVGGGLGITITQDLISLNVCRFLLGLGSISLWVNGLVIAMEIVGPSRRVLVGISMDVLWCVGLFILLPLAYLLRNWRQLMMALFVPSVGLLAYWCLIPESPRWLISKGRHKEAVKILERIAASNKTSMAGIELDMLKEDQTSLSFRHVFRSRELIVRMVIVFTNMFTLCMTYYALMLNVTNLAGDIFVNFLISIVVDTVGSSCPYFLLDRFGRKPIYSLSMMIAGAACVLSVVPLQVGAPDWVILSMTMVGRFFVCICFGVIYIYGAELFPTIIRASTMGVGVTFSRFGGFLSPYIADVGILMGGSLGKVLPLIILGIPTVVAGLSSLWLPETKGIKLPETFDDVHRLKSHRGRLCCRRRDPSTGEVTRENDDEMTPTSV